MIGEIQQAERVREEHAIDRRQTAGRAQRPRRADEVAEAVDRADRGVVERRLRRSAGQMRRVMLDPVHARGGRAYSSRPRRCGNRAGNAARCWRRCARDRRPVARSAGARARTAPCATGARADCATRRTRRRRGRRRPPSPGTRAIAPSRKAGACLMRRKRSSSTAATSSPSRTSTAETSPWYAFRPRMFMTR